MGCGGSAPPAASEPASSAPPPVVKEDSGEIRKKNTSMRSTDSKRSHGSTMSNEQSKVAHERLRKLRELDESTKIPFILVELRGESDRNGFVEICGKDEYGVYDSLDGFLTKSWGCVKLDGGDLNDNTPVPFCDATYKWEGYRATGSEGMSNMGLCSMRLIDFMSNTLSWTLGVINGGNVGKKGEIREQQIIFKAPHPMNLAVPHAMVELRSAGFIEVCSTDDGILRDLEQFFEDQFKVEKVNGHEDFCDRYYKAGKGVFQEKGRQGENNMGILTTKVCDFVGNLDGWNLVTMNGGNYGEKGTSREQQLVFRLDNHPLQAQPHIIVELRGSGYIEVCGDNVGQIYKSLENWLKKTWASSLMSNPTGDDRFFDLKFKWAQKDMMVSTAQVTQFFHEQGWAMQVCSQGTVKVAGEADSREQQILFRPGMSGIGVAEPHLFIELYAGEGEEDIYKKNGVTQVLGNQHIRMFPVGDCGDAIEKFHQFATDYLGGEPAEDRYCVDCFLSRGRTDNNLGCWTMRICDFMVDGLGWSFVVCNVCNLGDYGNFREQQLVFRYDGERRDIPITDKSLGNLDPNTFKGVKFPPYWQIPEIAKLQKVQAMMSCDQEECQALQELMDNTFKRILTRDRVYEYQVTTSEEMPYRLELVHAFRSENMPLTQRFLERRKKYKGGNPYPAKTRKDGKCVNDRLLDGDSLLFHGTNPSSAISILKYGFVLKNAGKSTGTMFGYGVYLAECSSKSDEYACDDGGGTFPGLRALLVCRSLIGNPYVVHQAGDYITEAKAGGCDCVLGDRETTVNTYREFVFFDESQVLPEYTIIYKRQYDPAKVPSLFKQKTVGTTGRSWQVNLGKGWANVAVEVNMKLLEAMLDGESIVEAEVAGFKYTFDIDKKEQTNLQTGMVRKLREPMVKPSRTTLRTSRSSTALTPS